VTRSCEAQWNLCWRRRARANMSDLPMLPNDGARTGAGAKSLDGLVAWTNSMLMGLSADGLAGLSRRQNGEALIEARTRLFADADDALNEELPVGKSVSLAGYQAVVVRLSKRLADMAEAYFENFNSHLVQDIPSTIAGADPPMTEKWLGSVIQTSTGGLWRDVDAIFANWLDQIRARTKGAAYGARPRSMDDPEYLTIQSHRERMSAALWRIAERHSIPHETVADTLREQGESEQGIPRALTPAAEPETVSAGPAYPESTTGTEPEPANLDGGTQFDAAGSARQSRAATVAKLIGELNLLKPQMFDDEAEYNKLRAQYPGFLTFKTAESRPHLKMKVLGMRGSTRHIRLAQELAAAHHGRELSTIQDDWKNYKPPEFKRPG